MSEPAIFWEFANTPATQEGFVTFADAWGELGLRDGVLYERGKDEDFETPVDTLAGWQAEHAAILRAIHARERGEWGQLESLINEGLRGQIAPLFRRTDDGRFVSGLEPLSLIGAIWLQLANHVATGSTLRRCEECRKWFVLAPGSKRVDATYCGGACKARAYRKRKKGSDGPA
jgi:hypothetical protein